jgi:hypothetical protein
MSSNDVLIGIWGFGVVLRGFSRQEIAELEDTFAGSVTPPSADDGATLAPQLLLVRSDAPQDDREQTGTLRQPRHRGGSSARKFLP